MSNFVYFGQTLAAFSVLGEYRYAKILQQLMRTPLGQPRETEYYNRYPREKMQFTQESITLRTLLMR
jgi:hypothetical protein